MNRIDREEICKFIVFLNRIARDKGLLRDSIPYEELLECDEQSLKLMLLFSIKYAI